MYFHTGSGVLAELNVTSVAGAATGDTKIAATPVPTFGDNKLVYKLGTSETAVTYGADLSSGWTDVPVDGNVAASTNTVVQIAEIDKDNRAIAVGKATVVKK